MICDSQNWVVYCPRRWYLHDNWWYDNEDPKGTIHQLISGGGTAEILPKYFDCESSFFIPCVSTRFNPVDTMFCMYFTAPILLVDVLGIDRA